MYYCAIVKTTTPVSGAAICSVAELFTLYCPESPSLPALSRDSLPTQLMVLLQPRGVILLEMVSDPYCPESEDEKPLSLTYSLLTLLQKAEQ